MNNSTADHADFRSFADRIVLAQRGIFSVDRTAHRNKREAEALAQATFNSAYEALGLDRDREHNRIAAEMEAHLTSGIWAKSTGEFAGRRDARDLEVLRAAWLNEGEAA